MGERTQTRQFGRTNPTAPTGDEVAWWRGERSTPSRQLGCSGFRDGVSNEPATCPTFLCRTRSVSSGHRRSPRQDACWPYGRAMVSGRVDFGRTNPICDGPVLKGVCRSASHRNYARAWRCRGRLSRYRPGQAQVKGCSDNALCQNEPNW